MTITFKKWMKLQLKLDYNETNYDNYVMTIKHIFPKFSLYCNR